jgi:hypothetical protein
MTQFGWWHSQLFMENHKIPSFQSPPISNCLWRFVYGLRMNYVMDYFNGNKFRDPRMENPYHIVDHILRGYSWNLGLKNRPYIWSDMVGTSNLGSWNGHWLILFTMDKNLSSLFNIHPWLTKKWFWMINLNIVFHIFISLMGGIILWYHEKPSIDRGIHGIHGYQVIGYPPWSSTPKIIV